MDRVDKIIAFEDGRMCEADAIEFIQELIDDGSAWTLQGFYGRVAMALIDAGLCEAR